MMSFCYKRVSINSVGGKRITIYIMHNNYDLYSLSLKTSSVQKKIIIMIVISQGSA